MAFPLIPPNPFSKLGTPGRHHLYLYIGSCDQQSSSHLRIFYFSSVQLTPLSPYQGSGRL
ncbi:hypothetical protein AKJ16_DCAP16246 [Drosera capensis]